MTLESFRFADHVVGFIANKAINTPLLDELHDQVDSALTGLDKISLYMEFHGLGTLHPSIISHDLKFKNSRRDRFDKVAIVTDSVLISSYIKILGLFMKYDLKTFSLKQRTTALQWVSMI
ncbi:MAG: hypothetical protein CL868_14155 [Cytophagaceae bacterium]|nr:hypothetical protein [Cytophagaceae bacterium]|tara:strand:+ start:1217 stop:1576 length:360 start_codon:yes stop_codon:yes gene_type:complete